MALSFALKNVFSNISWHSPFDMNYTHARVRHIGIDSRKTLSAHFTAEGYKVYSEISTVFFYVLRIYEDDNLNISL